MAALIVIGVFFAQTGADPGDVNWLTVLISFFGAGGLVAFFRLRPQNALDTANRAKILDELQTKVLNDFKRQFNELARELDAAKAELAEARRHVAERDIKIATLEREVERLHDRMAALIRGRDPERHTDERISDA